MLNLCKYVISRHLHLALSDHRDVLDAWVINFDVAISSCNIYRKQIFGPYSLKKVCFLFDK